MIPLKVKRLTETARLPTKGNTNDVGYDLYADEDRFIEVGSTVKINTNISLDMSNGYVAKVEDRSGLASKGLRTGAGVVDPNFRGAIQVVMHNISNTDHMNGTETLWDKAKIGYQVKAGDRVAQLLFYKVEAPAIVEVLELNDSERGVKGFGSSGL